MLLAEILLTLSCSQKENTIKSVVIADYCTHCNMLYSAPASPLGVKSFRCTVFCLPVVFNNGANVDRLTHLTPTVPAGLVIREKSTGFLLLDYIN